MRRTRAHRRSTTYRLVTSAVAFLAALLHLGPALAQCGPNGAFPCGPPGMQPGFPQAPGFPNQGFNAQARVGNRCYTQYGACFIGYPQPLGSGCMCPSPFGAVGGSVGN